MTYRVVYVDHVARLSGGEIALLRALPALRPAVDAHVIVGEDGPLVEELAKEGLSVEVLPLDPEARDVRKETISPSRLDPRAVLHAGSYTLKLARRLRELRPDLVHTNSLKAALYGGVAGRLAGVPVVWHIRDRIAPDYLPRPAVALVRVLARLLPRVIVANSSATLSTLPHVRSRAVVHNVIVHDAVASPSIESSGGGRRPFRFCMVGRLAQWKGQDVFLESFASAFGNEPNVEAWVVGSSLFGEDEYGLSLPLLAERLGIADRVVFRGFRSDVWGELAQVDAAVHCSVVPEPFGQVVVEAMAAGVPVIAAAEGGPAEIITHGIDGLLVRPGDRQGLASAMRRLHDEPDLRSALATAGLVTAARYSPEETARQILEVYRQAVGR